MVGVRGLPSLGDSGRSRLLYQKRTTNETDLRTVQRIVSSSLCLFLTNTRAAPGLLLFGTTEGVGAKTAASQPAKPIPDLRETFKVWVWCGSLQQKQSQITLAGGSRVTLGGAWRDD